MRTEIARAKAWVCRVGLAAALAVAGCDAEQPERPEAGAVSSRPVETPRKAVSQTPRPRLPKGTRVGYVVVDRVSGRTVRYRPHLVFRSASVVKILIALDHLERNGKTELTLLRPMLRSSDDDAATRLWRQGGQGKIVTRMAGRMGLTETRPPPAERPGFWGYTALSAADVAKMYRYLLEKARPEYRDLIVGELRKATRCGTDGYDQSFGIPRAVARPWAVKQGWSGFPEGPRGCGNVRPAVADLGVGRPVLHTTGIVGPGYRKIVVVLTLQPAGTSFATASAKLTALTKQLYRG
jgi:hypothetical protein